MKKTYLLLLVALISIGVMSGCDRGDKTSEKAIEKKAAEQKKTAEQSKHGGTFVMNQAAEPSQFGYPLNIRHSDAHYAWYAGLQTLVELSTEKLGRWDPCLAESWELAPDKSTYVFHLRKGVKFHDGTDFNAQAVKWNLDKVMASSSPYLKKVSSIDVIDDYTIRCNLIEWDAILLDDFGNGACSIISPTAFEKNGGEAWANINPVGTGPFKLKSFSQRQYMKLVRNDDYWEEGLPYLDGLDILNIADPMTAVASLKRGEVMGLRDVDVVTASQLKGSGYEFSVVSGGHMCLYFNTIDPESVWSDKRMREALEYATNKEEITSRLGFGFIDPVYEIIFDINVIADPKTTPRKHNVEKAKKLMAEAGYGDGLKIKCTYYIGFASDLLMALQNNLAEVGIELEMNPLKHTVAIEKSQNPTSGNDIRFTRQRGGMPLLKTTKEELGSDSQYFVGIKRTEGFDEKLARAALEVDPEKQLELLIEAEELAYEDCMYVPLWTDPSINLHVPEFKDTVWFVGKPNVHFERAWFEK
ncbi:MAG: ABC transporter substrate-binding protein [Deltaproteobacteria bacterium]|nr:ABC transporter substrate-binding protein [Deltaproteobacteria bacterium]MBW1915984.1 ABC transporter substrate-binding protein [Deltaproteobacteria bacterium]